MTVSFTKPVVCPILIGRTPDLAALHLLAERAKSGQGQVALLSGEADIGKSRLVAELKTSATAQGFQLLQELTQHDEAQLLRLIKELIAAQLVVEESEERFAFRHALTRQAVCPGLSGDTRHPPWTSLPGWVASLTIPRWRDAKGKQ